MARSGQLRHSVRIESPVERSDGRVGGVVTTWELFDERWADQVPGNGREFVATQQVHAELTHLLHVRFDPDKVVTPKHRVIFNGAELNILGAPRVRLSGKNEMQRLSCRELVDGS